MHGQADGRRPHPRDTAPDPESTRFTYFRAARKESFATSAHMLKLQRGRLHEICGILREYCVKGGKRGLNFYSDKILLDFLNFYLY